MSALLRPDVSRSRPRLTPATQINQGPTGRWLPVPAAGVGQDVVAEGAGGVREVVVAGEKGDEPAGRPGFFQRDGGPGCLSRASAARCTGAGWRCRCRRPPRGRRRPAGSPAGSARGCPWCSGCRAPARHLPAGRLRRPLGGGGAGRVRRGHGLRRPVHARDDRGRAGRGRTAAGRARGRHAQRRASGRRSPRSGPARQHRTAARPPLRPLTCRTRGSP